MVSYFLFNTNNHNSNSDNGNTNNDPYISSSIDRRSSTTIAKNLTNHIIYNQSIFWQHVSNNNNNNNNPNIDNIQIEIAQFEPRYGWLHVYVTSVILGLLILCTIIGNVFVVAAIILERNLQSVSNYLILSLAVADLLVASLVMSVSVINEVSKNWFLGIGLCDFFVCFDVLCCSASILHLVAIAFDRYWAVTNIDYMRLRTSRRIIIMIALVWLVSIIISIPSRFYISRNSTKVYKQVVILGRCDINEEYTYTIFSTVGAFYMPMFLLIGVYAKIYQTARARIRRRAFLKQKNLKESISKGGTSLNNNHKHFYQKELRFSIDNLCRRCNCFRNVNVKTSSTMINTSTNYNRRYDCASLNSLKTYGNSVTKIKLKIYDENSINDQLTDIPSSSSSQQKYFDTTSNRFSYNQYSCHYGFNRSHIHVLSSPKLKEPDIEDEEGEPEEENLTKNDRLYSKPDKVIWNWKETSSLTDSPRLTAPDKPNPKRFGFKPTQVTFNDFQTSHNIRYKIHNSTLPHSVKLTNNIQYCSDACLKYHKEDDNDNDNNQSTESSENISMKDNDTCAVVLVDFPPQSQNPQSPDKAETATIQSDFTNVTPKTTFANTTKNMELQKQKLEHRRERKAARTLAIITGCFILCWLPFFIQALIVPFCGMKCAPHPSFSSFMLWLGYCNSLLNPIIYTIFSPEFRNAFNKILFGRYQRTKRRH